MGTDDLPVEVGSGEGIIVVEAGIEALIGVWVQVVEVVEVERGNAGGRPVRIDGCLCSVAGSGVVQVQDLGDPLAGNEPLSASVDPGLPLPLRTQLAVVRREGVERVALGLGWNRLDVHSSRARSQKRAIFSQTQRMQPRPKR
jgi:hypothetical protein